MHRHVKPLRVLSTCDADVLRLQLMVVEYKQRMGARLRTAREDKGWSQGQLARAVDELRLADNPDAALMDGSSISRYEKGKVEPSPEMKDYLARALDRDVAFFLMDEPDKTRTPDLFAVDGDGEKSMEVVIRDLLREQSRILKEIKTNQKDIKDALAALPAVAEGLTELLRALEAEHRPGRRAGGEG